MIKTAYGLRAMATVRTIEALRMSAYALVIFPSRALTAIATFAAAGFTTCLQSFGYSDWKSAASSRSDACPYYCWTKTTAAVSGWRCGVRSRTPPL